MATFPSGIFSPRTKENKAGVVYDADKKQICFAEDVTKLDAEIVAVQTFLLDKEKVIWVPVEAFKIPTLKPASFVEYGIGSALEFADGNEEICLAKMHVPYDLDPATQPKLVLGWSTPAETKDCRWKVEYLWRTSAEAMNAAAEGTITDDYESLAGASTLKMEEIQLANLASGDVCLVLRITRLGDAVEDTLAESAFLSGICLIYRSNVLGKTP